jgi:hypothetical protein
MHVIPGMYGQILDVFSLIKYLLDNYIITLGAHTPKGYGSRSVCVCLSVC